MKLKSSNATYPKFTNHGDCYDGIFVKFEQDKDGRFGPETILTLTKQGGQEISVRCPASLARTLSQNLTLLRPGVWVRCEYVDDVDTGKGNPAKIFEVEVEDKAPWAGGPGASPAIAPKAEHAPAPVDDDDAAGDADEIPF